MEVTLKKMTNQLKSIIDASRRLVFFGGAGVSTASGIPDFRSASGLYSGATKTTYAPEEILSHDFFFNHTAEFYQFYRQHMIFPKARPNSAHKALVQLEKEGKLTAVVTQNIDGLHQKAGSRSVFELHGSVHRNTCLRCHKKFSLSFILHASAIPHCDVCGGLIKPDVVLYGEELDEMVVQAAVRQIYQADSLIVGGTSLVVYPAAGLLRYFRGNHLVLINQQVTPYDQQADVVIHANIATVLAPYSTDLGVHA